MTIAETKTKTIEGVEYHLQKWPASKSLEWAERISRVSGPATAHVLSDDLVAATRSFLSELKEQGSLLDLVKRCLEGTVFVKQGEAEALVPVLTQFDSRFRDCPHVPMHLAFWVLRECCGPFFDGVGWIGEGLVRRFKDVLKPAASPVMEDEVRELDEMLSAVSKLDEVLSTRPSQPTSEATDEGGSKPASGQGASS